MGADKSHISNNHWNYFLALDADVVQISRYVELSEANFDSYSIELSRLLFAGASEVDVLAKMICIDINKDSKADNIHRYRREIHPNNPLVSRTQVHVPRFGLTFQPWEEWQNDKSPQWWDAYISVKHRRNTDFAKANLENSLNAVAGLFVLLLFHFRNQGEKGLLAPDPILFRAGDPFSGGRNMYEPYAEIYHLSI